MLFCEQFLPSEFWTWYLWYNRERQILVSTIPSPFLRSHSTLPIGSHSSEVAWEGSFYTSLQGSFLIRVVRNHRWPNEMPWQT